MFYNLKIYTKNRFLYVILYKNRFLQNNFIQTVKVVLPALSCVSILRGLIFLAQCTNISTEWGIHGWDRRSIIIDFRTPYDLVKSSPVSPYTFAGLAVQGSGPVALTKHSASEE